ncbi:MAG: signal recognition particle-docking protein FtsY, partial [Phascolarctobacterium sp.]|nr:signal recognition particle-docking protein FtsY [Phascolarctobacterium sp.]
AAKKNEIKGTEEVIPFLKKYLSDMLADSGQRTRIGAKPTVILVVGVNGVGKTTTIGKLANYFTLFKYKVVLAAGDTFRAAASEQLTIWAGRAGCDIIKHAEGADPAAVVFDAMKAAIARKADILFIDTAGRLHNKANLMNELEKVHRIIKREIPEAPHETFLVLDATTGQNAINQAKVFMETANVTGVVLTKLDGTAKGGVVIAIKEELGLPVKWIGVGEGIMDFRPFEPEKFVEALFETDK